MYEAARIKNMTTVVKTKEGFSFLKEQKAQSRVLLVWVWWLNNVRANFSEILLFLGLKVAATASAINSLLKAKKRRNHRDSCTHSFDKHVSSDHTLPDTIVGTGYGCEHDWQSPARPWIHLCGRRQTVNRQIHLVSRSPKWYEGKIKLRKRQS